MNPPPYHPNGFPTVQFVPPPVTYGVPPRPPQPSRTSGLAVASLVCGLVGLFTFGIAALPAVLLGYAARREDRRLGRPRDATATAGIVLGWVVLVAGAVLLVLAAMWVGSAATRHG